VDKALEGLVPSARAVQSVLQSAADLERRLTFNRNIRATEQRLAAGSAVPWRGPSDTAPLVACAWRDAGALDGSPTTGAVVAEGTCKSLLTGGVGAQREEGGRDGASAPVASVARRSGMTAGVMAGGSDLTAGGRTVSTLGEAGGQTTGLQGLVGQEVGDMAMVVAKADVAGCLLTWAFPDRIAVRIKPAFSNKPILFKFSSGQVRSCPLAVVLNSDVHASVAVSLLDLSHSRIC
jgi:hypothetical protein